MQTKIIAKIDTTIKIKIEATSKIKIKTIGKKIEKTIKKIKTKTINKTKSKSKNITSKAKSITTKHIVGIANIIKEIKDKDKTINRANNSKIETNSKKKLQIKIYYQA